MAGSFLIKPLTPLTPTGWISLDSRFEGVSVNENDGSGNIHVTFTRPPSNVSDGVGGGIWAIAANFYWYNAQGVRYMNGSMGAARSNQSNPLTITFPIPASSTYAGTVVQFQEGSASAYADVLYHDDVPQRD